MIPLRGVPGRLISDACGQLSFRLSLSLSLACQCACRLTTPFEMLLKIKVIARSTFDANQ
jgi:hypothetical protein